MSKTNEFCPPSCGFYDDRGEVKGGCDECSHSNDTIYSQAILGMWLGSEVTIVGESDKSYYLDDGSSILKSSTTLL